MPPAIVVTPPSPSIGWRLSFDIEKLLPIDDASQRLKFTLGIVRPGGSADCGAVVEILRARKQPNKTPPMLIETLLAVTLPKRGVEDDGEKNSYKFTGTLRTDVNATDELSLRLIANNQRGQEPPQTWPYARQNVRLRKKKTA